MAARGGASAPCRPFGSGCCTTRRRSRPPRRLPPTGRYRGSARHARRRAGARHRRRVPRFELARYCPRGAGDFARRPEEPARKNRDGFDETTFLSTLDEVVARGTTSAEEMLTPTIRAGATRSSRPFWNMPTTAWRANPELSACSAQRSPSWSRRPLDSVPQASIRKTWSFDTPHGLGCMWEGTTYGDLKKTIHVSLNSEINCLGVFRKLSLSAQRACRQHLLPVSSL